MVFRDDVIKEIKSLSNKDSKRNNKNNSKRNNKNKKVLLKRLFELIKRLFELIRLDLKYGRDNLYTLMLEMSGGDNCGG